MPANTGHYVGGTKHFECRVKGHPRPQLRWFKDSKEITDNSRYNFDVSHDGVISMVIEHITHDDEGHYRCRAENCEGIASTSAYLFVREHKDHPEEAHTSIHAMQVEEAILFTEKEKMERRLSAAANNGLEPHFQEAIHDVEEGGVSTKKRMNKEEEEVVKRTFNNLIEESSSTRKITTTIEETTRIKKSVTTRTTEAESSKIEVDQLEKVYNSEGSFDDDDEDSVKLSAISERSETTSSFQDILQDLEKDESKSLLMKQTAKIIRMDDDKTEDEFGAVSSKSESVEVISKSMEVSEKSSVTSSKQESFESSSVTKTEAVQTKVETKSDLKSIQQTDTRKGKEMIEAGTESAAESETASSVNSVVAVETSKKSSTATAVEETTKKKVSKQMEIEEMVSKKSIKTSESEVSDIIRKSDEELDVSEQTARWIDQIETVTEMENFAEVEEGDEKTKKQKRKEEEKLISKPEFVGLLEDVSMEAGNALKLRTQISGIPEPQVTWSKNGKVIVTSERITMTQEKEVHTLEIQKSSVSDSGKYTLTASNEGGEISMDVFVTITMKEAEKSVVKPKFTGVLEDMSVEAGSVLKLTTKISGTPEPQLTWSKDGKVLVKSESITMTLEKDVYSLVIQKSSVSDSGKYTLTASNEGGEISKDVTVNVSRVADESMDKAAVDVPKFTMEPQDIKVAEFESIKLSCSASGDPAPTITWEKDGKRLRSNQFTRIYEDRGVHYLEIADCDIEDAGEYVCTATNAKGKESLSVKVSIEEMTKSKKSAESEKEPTPVDEELLKKKNQTEESDAEKKKGKKEEKSFSKPEFTGLLEDMSVEAGNVLKLTTKISGTPEPKVTWSKDGKVLVKSESITMTHEKDVYSLVIQTSSVSDSGKYTLTASNEGGEISKDVTVNVSRVADKSKDKGAVDVPKFTMEPQDIKVAELESIKLSCSASGDPAPTITWEKDGKRLRSNQFTRIYEDRGVHYLEIADCDIEDAGEYVCTATNAKGKESLSVKVSIEEMTKSKKSAESEKEPTPVDEELLKKKNQTEESDAEKKKGKKEEKSFSKPEFTGLLEDMSVEAGNVLKLTTKISGTPEPKVTWSKDGKVLVKSESITMTHEKDVYSLVIQTSSVSDSGKYTLTASNEGGEISKDVTVNVSRVADKSKDKAAVDVPKFTMEPQDIKVAEFESIKLSCSVSGDPAPTITWEKDGKRLRSNQFTRIYEDRGVHYLEIADCDIEDAGEYVCTATNAKGKESLSVKVSIEEMTKAKKSAESEKEPTPVDEELLKKKNQTEESDAEKKKGKEEEKSFSKPEFTGLLEDMSVEAGNVLKLTTKISGTPEPQVTWSKDGKVLVKSKSITMTHEKDVYSLEIQKSSVSDSGKYTLTASNEGGEISMDVSVTITEVAVATDSTDGKSKDKAAVDVPKFTMEPQDIKVAEFETIKLSCSVSGDPAPTITWEKDGKRLRSNKYTRIYEDRGVHYLEIADCDIEDAGEYVCTATNAKGTESLSLKVSIEEMTKSKRSPETEKETTPMSNADATLEEKKMKMKDQIEASSSAVEASTEDGEEGKLYKVLMEYQDTETKITLEGGDVVEVLDTKQPGGKWKVRVKGQSDKICNIPSDNLTLVTKSGTEENKNDLQSDGDKESKKKKLLKIHSSKSSSFDMDFDTSEDEIRLQGIFPDYVAIADYVPPEGDTTGVRLSEGQIVEVIDMERPDSWLIRTRPSKSSPSRQGWVPSAYLEEKTASAQVLKRTSKEQFREDVLQVSNKQQEAVLRRRYVLKELEETEREYVKDLKHVVERFKASAMESPQDMPETLAANVDIVFSNIDDIYKFHNDKFLNAVAACTVETSATGSTFLEWKSEFDNYIQYWTDRDASMCLLESEEVLQYFKDLGNKLNLSGENISDRLNTPLDRLKMYQVLLKDILRYSVRAGENCAEIEDAIAMLLSIEKAVNNGQLLPQLEGCDVDISDMENMWRHDDFLVWEGDVIESRVKDRHGFLFDDKLILTKKRKQESAVDEPVYAYKSAIDLSSVRLNGTVAEDERRFELWFLEDSAVEKITFQARSVYAQQAWVRDIEEALIALGISDPYRMPEKTVEVPEDEDSLPSAPGTPTATSGPDTASSREGQGSDEGESTPNDGGESDSTIKAEVKEEQDTAQVDEQVGDVPTAPFFKHDLKKVICTESGCAQLECVVGGHPTPTIKWSKGSKRILSGSGIDISLEEGVSTVTFTKVRSSQAGTYTVTLTNSSGTVSQDVELVVELDSENKATPETESAKETLTDGIDSSSPERNEAEKSEVEEEIIEVEKFEDALEQQVELVTEEFQPERQEVEAQKQDQETTEKKESKAEEVEKKTEVVEEISKDTQEKVEVVEDNTQKTKADEKEESVEDKTKKSPEADETDAKPGIVQVREETQDGSKLNTDLSDQTDSTKVEESKSETVISAESEVSHSSKVQEESKSETVISTESEVSQSSKVEEESKSETVISTESEVSQSSKVEEESKSETVISTESEVSQSSKSEESESVISVDSEVQQSLKSEAVISTESEVPESSKSEESESVILVDSEVQQSLKSEAVISTESEVPESSKSEESETVITVNSKSETEISADTLVTESSEVEKSESVTKIVEKEVEEAVSEKQVAEPVAEKKVEEPVAEKKVEEPVAEKKVEEPVAEKKVEEPVAEKKVEEPVAEKKVEEPVAEKEVAEPVAEKKVAEPVAEKKVEEPVAEKKVAEPVAEKKVEEPVAEKKVEEPVAEKKVEEPVAEKEVAEPVAEKKVAEPIAEKKVAEPVAEKKVAEPVAEKKVAEPVAEKKVAEPVAEKKVEEPVAEKKVAEPVAEKKVAEPVAEKKVEEPVAEKKVAEPVAEKKVEEPVAEKKFEEPVAEKKVKEPVTEKKFEEPVAEKVAEPAAEKKVKEPVVEKKVKEPVAEPVVEKKVEETVAKEKPEDSVAEKEVTESVSKKEVAESVLEKETSLQVSSVEEKRLSEEEKEREHKKKDRKPDAPQVLESMDDVVIELGDLARFDCRVSAYPDPEITWLKDGHQVKVTDRHQLLNFHDDIFSLLIKDVEREDSGKYTCLAKNKHGQAKSEAILNVLALKEKIEDAHIAPAFLTKFYDIEAVEGVPVEFVCVVDGQPEPTVTWMLNGKVVESGSEILTRRQDDSVMLAFRSVQIEHSGEIVCKIKNDSGESICKARLQVREDVTKRGDRPLFVERPSDTEVSEGGEVSFECVISGMPEPEVTWYFNSRELHESRRRSMRRRAGQKYILTINDIIPENAGVYTCKAVNRAGDASCAVELSVKELPSDQPYRGRSYDTNLDYDTNKYAFPPSFTRRMRDLRVLPGRMARFECMVIGVPEPEVEWQKDGYSLKWGPKYKIGREGHTAILVVENCDTIDEGVYTCSLFNDAGKAFCSASLKVQVKERSRESLPRFISPALGVDGYKKSPTPMRRSKARSIAPEDKIPSMPIDKPVLLEVKSNAAKLSWMPAPTAMLPDNAQKISYIIEAKEQPSKTWVRLDGQINATTHYVYGLKPEKEYNFRVKAENRYGVSEATLPCNLLPREEPKVPYFTPRESETPSRPVLPRSCPYISDIGKETVRLGWKPAEIPYKRATSMPPVSYRVEAQKLPSEEWVPLASRIRKPSLYLSDLEPDRDYNIRVRAQTPYGISQPTDPLWIPRAKSFTGVPVSRPNIVEIDDDTARLAWTRVNIPAFDRTDDPLLYMVEMQEPPSYRWRELARRVPDTHYIVRDLDQGQDYRFRVRAETKEGLLSEPSPATSMFRMLALTHTPVDSLEIEEYEPDLEALRLKWRKVDVPPYSNVDSPLLYMIEYQSPDADDWKKLVSGVPTTRYRIPDISPSSDYRFRVRGLTPYGASPPSYPIGLRRSTTPMRPLAQDLRISDMQPESLSLSWRSASVPPTKSGELPSYQIEAMEYPKREWRPLASNIRDTNYRLSGLKSSSDYSFRVRAQTPSGLLEPTAPITLTSLPVKPRLPNREPIISELGSDSIKLEWKAAELPYYSRHITPITYKVEYQEIPSRDWVVARRSIPDTSYTMTGLRADRDYRFRVCPETKEGPGEYSLPVNIHRKPAPVLPSKEPVLSNISPSSATLSWQPAKLPSTSLGRTVFYRVEVREPPRSAWNELARRLTTCSYDVLFLYPDQDYMFRIIAEHDGIDSDPSMSVYLPHRSGPPKMSRDSPYASNVQPDSLILSWRSVELPSRITDYSPVTYRVEVQENNRADWHPLARQINQTHFQVTKLRPDLDYSFRIRAENEFGISEPTDALVVRKRAVTPTISQHEPLISDVRSDSLRLSWQPAELPLYLADSVPVTYNILMQEAGDAQWQTIMRRVHGTNYYVTGLSPDKDYSFRVQATNDFGTSIPTMPARLTRQFQGPIYIPEIEDPEPSSFRLSWKQPSVSKKTTYAIETLEPSSWKWRPLVSHLPHPSYKVTNLEPSRDYAFRVRAETNSVVSEPSLPISYSIHRALPTLPVERPTMSEVFDDSVRVSWHPVLYRGATHRSAPQGYRLEVRELPDAYWKTLVPNTDKWSFEVTDLKPNQDYAFRVRTVTKSGMSEPSLPAYLYRKSVTPKVPLPSPEVSEVGDDYIGLQWKMIDVPAFEYDEKPLSFIIEAQRVPEYDWKPVARGITGASHKVTGLEPKQDYQFRIRGETPIGLTQPTMPIPVYRKPLGSGIPITNFSIDSDSNQPYSARLKWNPVYIRPYTATRDTTYTVEIQEPPRRDWYSIARDVPTTSYTVPDLSPRKDYLFRVKAKAPSGEYSLPTPPVPYYREPSSSWDTLPSRPLPVTEEYSPINRPYIEGLVLKVPPRMSIEKPEMFMITPDVIRLSWKSARVPSATAHLSPVTYRVEVRHEDSFEWVEKVTGVRSLGTDIRGLNPHVDYAFRVRAVNEFGWSECTLPVFLHRPQKVKDEAAEMEFEEYEVTGSLLGDTSAPKMPIDSPRMGPLDNQCMKLSWTPARIPAYARKTPIFYNVEKKETTDTEWNIVAKDVLEPFYMISGIRTGVDYLFRVKAQNQYGISEATLPAALNQTRGPSMGRRSTMSRERDSESLSSSRRSSYSYIDSIAEGVPPRVPHGRPTISDVTETTLILSWNKGRMPSYIHGKVKIQYIVEAREPPNHLWRKLDSEVDGTSFKVIALRSNQDYMFRVRAHNDAGMSEPTLPVTFTRERVVESEPRTMRRRSSIERFSSVERRLSRERSMSMDRGSSVTRSASVTRDGSKKDGEDEEFATPDTAPSAPSFVENESPSTQYGIDARPVKITLQLKGIPLPNVDWYIDGKKVLYGDRHEGYVTPTGLVVLEFAPMKWSDVGEYKCAVENELGETSMVVKLEIADPPIFIRPLDELTLQSQTNGQFACRVEGLPTPTVKFLKDWRPITQSSRIKVSQDGDNYTLNIEKALPSDAGCYICMAENVAGSVFCTARLSVDEEVIVTTVYYKKNNIEDDYYILEELGRGCHSIVRRVIEKSTGKEYAAKFTQVREDRDKDFFRLELDALLRQNGEGVEKLHDAYETQRQLILVVDIIKSGTLLDKVINDDQWSEAKAAQIIKKLLLILESIHKTYVVHLDVKPSNLRLASTSYDSLTLTDFGFARKLPLSKDLIMNHGTPEFCSPESVKCEALTTASDMWAVGVITHILLTGVSPFYGDTIQETLSHIQTCNWQIKDDLFSKLSESAKDFIIKLLVMDPEARLTIEACLAHDWLKLAEKTDTHKIDISSIKAFHERRQREQQESSVRGVACLRSLQRLLDGTAVAQGIQPEADPNTGEMILPNTEEYGQYLDEESWYEWQSRHQQGPDSELFPLKDASYTARVRGYRRAAGSIDDGAPPVIDSDDELDPKDKERMRTMKERKLMSEIDREEIPPSLEKELEFMEETKKRRKSRDPDEFSISSKRSSIISIPTEGMPGPVFKEKLHDMAFGVGDTVILRCVVVIPPAATVVWYRNEELLSEGHRLKMSLEEDGEATLTIRNAKPYDAGVYKCVGRNKFGRVSNRMRLRLGDVPGRSGRPVASQVSSTEMVIIWEAPHFDGNSDILFYKLDYKTTANPRWITAAYTPEEAAYISGLEPDTAYMFRVSATNRIGTGHYSWASVNVCSRAEGSVSITSDDYVDLQLLKDRQQLEQPALPTEYDDIIPEGELNATEPEISVQKAQPDSMYNIESLLYKGKFYEDKAISLPSDNDKPFILRTIHTSKEASMEEFNTIKSLKHERVLKLYHCFEADDLIHFVLEHLESEYVARHLSHRRKYTENTVAVIIRQVLFGLEYLHRHELAHLNLQPASVLVSKREGPEIKLADFSCARKIASPDGEMVARVGYPDFIAPEVVVQDLVDFAADVWGIGVLTYVLLSGLSPFKGENDVSTLVNVAFNRYDAADLYENITTDALKFLYKVMKRIPRNRLTIQECLDHKWLQLTDKLTKDKDGTVFLSNTLATFVQEYDADRQREDFQQDFQKVELPIKMATIPPPEERAKLREEAAKKLCVQEAARAKRSPTPSQKSALSLVERLQIKADKLAEDSERRMEDGVKMKEEQLARIERMKDQILSMSEDSSLIDEVGDQGGKETSDKASGNVFEETRENKEDESEEVLKERGPDASGEVTTEIEKIADRVVEAALTEAMESQSSVSDIQEQS